MSAFELGRPPKRFGPGRKVLYGIVVIALVVAGIYFLPRFEWHAPQIKITPDTDRIGLSPIEIDVNERGRGLKSVSVTLSAGGTDHLLAEKQYNQPVMHEKISVALSSKLTGLKEGPATLRVSARDRSLWGFFRGNRTLVDKKVTIDITPPTVELVADDAYINFGGSGLIVYKPSPDTIESGVKIGPYFFPGYKGQTQDSAAYVAFFAHPYNVPESEKAVLIATDKAGNSRRIVLNYTLKNVRYKKSTIHISDDFIQRKVAPLLNDVGAQQSDPKDIFVKVNRDLRKENEDKIRTVGQKTVDKILWSGPFSQLSNSKVEANFADARTYLYHGQTIDHAYHLGFDLSVTKHYPVEAANSGRVTFVGDLGIYGNTVIIDHGLGLSTLYAHMSSIDVKEGEEVKKQQILGKTGETGLAAGDHLHFGVLLDGVPVLPLEWWDRKWIHDNITSKLGASSVAADQETTTPAKLTRKRRR
ncbi:MAG TPA: M23 family metallopeptidase [Terriglobales bacterium]|nr:M23 family metallopeptidase [Terriglobales bacterium]